MSSQYASSTALPKVSNASPGLVLFLFSLQFRFDVWYSHRLGGSSRWACQDPPKIRNHRRILSGSSRWARQDPPKIRIRRRILGGSSSWACQDPPKIHNDQRIFGGSWADLRAWPAENRPRSATNDDGATTTMTTTTTTTTREPVFNISKESRYRG